MSVKGFKRNYKPFEILPDDQIENIYKSVLRVLEKTGVAFHDNKALKLFEMNGCKVDFENDRVRFPNKIVEDCLACCPSSFKVTARDPENSLILGRENVSYFSPAAGSTTLDLDTWEHREPTRREFYNHITVLDALPNVHRMSAFPYFGFANVPQCMRLLESNAAKIRNSTKVQGEGSLFDNYRWNIQMAKATGQDLLCLANPSPPLTFYESTVSSIYAFIEREMPFHISSGPLAGTTAPATIVGSLVTHCAETIAGIVLAQLIKPGTKIWADNMTMVTNMKTGSPAFGAIENALNEVIFNQFWRRHKIPTWSSASAWTSSKAIDYQAAYETSMSAMICAISGAIVIIMQGGLTGELTAHPVKAILDDEIVGTIGRFLRGVEVNDQNLALDVIDEVGPIPGHFLDTMHTFETWKREQYLPVLGDRLSFPKWAELGKKKILDYAMEKKEKIISTHKPQPLPPNREQEIEDILNDARKYYRKKGEISDHEWKVYQKDIKSINYPYA